jgi:hypothetical protein
MDLRTVGRVVSIPGYLVFLVILVHIAGTNHSPSTGATRFVSWWVHDVFHGDVLLASYVLMGSFLSLGAGFFLRGAESFRRTYREDRGVARRTLLVTVLIGAVASVALFGDVTPACVRLLDVPPLFEGFCGGVEAIETPAPGSSTSTAGVR